MASCSPDIPDLTTKGHLRKAWEQSKDGTNLIKESPFEGGLDLESELLSAVLCCLLYGQDAYQPLSIVERLRRRFTSSPLMIGRDEELVQGRRLFSMGGFNRDEASELMGPTTPQIYFDVMSRADVADVSVRLRPLVRVSIVRHSY